MITNISLLMFALASSQAAAEPGLMIATDKDLSTSVRLVETTDTVRFEFVGPDFVAPSVAIDINRNGMIDRDSDFQVGLNNDGSFCLQYLLSETASTICKPLGLKAKFERSQQGHDTTTVISFPKREISGDGFGFGFAISLWNETGNYATPLAGGDYQFGGKVSLVRDGPNFKGEAKPNIAPEVLRAIHGYEGCLDRSIKALGAIDSTKIEKLKAVPASCAEERARALREGISALAASGIQKNEAAETMSDNLSQLDAGITGLVEMVNKGR